MYFSCCLPWKRSANPFSDIYRVAERLLDRTKQKRGETVGLLIDGFAGGGGASTGIAMALGRSVDIAIDHDPD